MKRINYFFMVLSLAALAFTGCSDSEELIVDENERIIGKWTVDSQTLLEVNVPGDGSWLSFDGCETGDCSGIDYMASDETSGTFSYSFGADKTTLVLVDNDPEAGGNYSGEWTIDEFTNNMLVISLDTGLFGVTTITLKK
ncbi:MAG: hypothetical protein P8X57_00085 [Cyclobacteriaceae bacterium]